MTPVINKEELMRTHATLSMLEEHFMFKQNTEGAESCKLLAQEIERVVQNMPKEVHLHVHKPLPELIGDMMVLRDVMLGIMDFAGHKVPKTHHAMMLLFEDKPENPQMLYASTADLLSTSRMMRAYLDTVKIPGMIQPPEPPKQT